MASEIQPTFSNSLIEANRALIELGAIHCRERDNSVSKTVRDCLFTYTHLLTFQQSTSLGPDQSAQLQVVLDRLKAYLRFFGEDV
jgi:hypothetical protein